MLLIWISDLDAKAKSHSSKGQCITTWTAVLRRFQAVSASVDKTRFMARMKSAEERR